MRLLLPGMLLLVAQLFDTTSAGCGGEAQGHCYYYEKGVMRSDSSCKIVQCSNIYDTFWNWKWDNGNEVVIRFEDDSLSVNGQPGFLLELQGADHLSCYGIAGTDELLYSRE